MGWGPGIALFTVFAALPGYSGFLLWEPFMGLDSYEYPIRSYVDIGYRLYGRWIRHLFNILQSIQLLLNVGLIVISNGEALSQVAKFKLCFVVCCLIWAIVGFLVGQVRTLQKFGWLANAAVWINLICMFITMGGAAHSPPTTPVPPRRLVPPLLAVLSLLPMPRVFSPLSRPAVASLTLAASSAPSAVLCRPFLPTVAPRSSPSSWLR